MTSTTYTHLTSVAALPRFLTVLLACLIFAVPANAQKTSTSQSDLPYYKVTATGATGDGKTMDTAAIQKSIDKAASSGGGTVFFPPGRYLSGSLHLRDNVTLHLGAGAVLVASTKQEDFDPYETLPYETGSDEETSYFHHALIWGEKVSNVAIIGQGTIDSNRTERSGPKPIAFKRCKHITIRDITILNSPNYAISPIGSDYINIDGVTILNGFCDGIDPDCCRHVRISNCHIETYDDAICPKSSFALGEPRATENVTVTNCIVRTSCNGFKLGTESHGGFKNITVNNLVVLSPTDARPATSGVSLETVDGALVENITVSNVVTEGVTTPIFIRLANRGRYAHGTFTHKKGKYAPVKIVLGSRGGDGMEKPVPGILRNVTISNVESTGATIPCSITGMKDRLIEGVTFSNIRIHYKGGGKKEWVSREVPEKENAYPNANMFGNKLPTFGMFCRHVRNLRLRDVELVCDSKDERPAIICDDVHNLQISGFTGSLAGVAPYIWLKDVTRAMISQCVAPSETGLFLKMSGKKTSHIRVIGNDLSEVAKVFEKDTDMPKDVLYETSNNLPSP